MKWLFADVWDLGLRAVGDQGLWCRLFAVLGCAILFSTARAGGELASFDPIKRVFQLFGCFGDKT